MTNKLSWISERAELSSLTSWLVGGVADYLALPTTEEQLVSSLQFAHQNQLPITILGGGTNVLISDAGVRGLVLCLRKLSGLEIELSASSAVVRAWSGTSKSELLKAFLKLNLAPARLLAGLPGDVGGGVVMNAGVSESIEPREFGQMVQWCEIIDAKPPFSKKVLRAEQIEWRYRHSYGWQPGIILRVGFSWPRQEQAGLIDEVRAANRERLRKQPLDLPSCGSVFVNPPGLKAGALIDQCGLRGYRRGDAQVSKKHANFIVNLGKATAADIYHVICYVRSEVLRQKSVSLTTEVVYLGEWPSQV